MNFTNQINKLIQDIGPDILIKVATTIAVLILLGVLRLIVLKVAYKKTQSTRSYYYWRKISSYVSVVLGIIIIGRIWFEVFGAIGTFLGLLSAGIAIALKDPLVNVAGWLFIIWRRPFDVGDRIQIGNYSGDVVDIRIFQFTMLEIGNWVDADQHTGRLVDIPNAIVFQQPQANYSKGFNFIWHEVPVLLTYESDWKAAKDILQIIVRKFASPISEKAEKSVREASQRYMITHTSFKPAVYTTVKSSGILFTVRFLIDPRKRRLGEEKIWEMILTEFAKHDNIDFAYSTIRYYDNLTEGKPGTKPDNPEK